MLILPFLTFITCPSLPFISPPLPLRSRPSTSCSALLPYCIAATPLAQLKHYEAIVCSLRRKWQHAIYEAILLVIHTITIEYNYKQLLRKLLSVRTE